ncbi:hypothetical protein KSP40_PGU003761 [Platanthera guangdongensis]|uniref:Copper amine oxidase N2-terminal domain-containing protein n=1 Tax=Platanthera guangdongensis TaxID=2320717 RepID=A0ABR2LP01_9ASPA
MESLIPVSFFFLVTIITSASSSPPSSVDSHLGNIASHPLDPLTFSEISVARSILISHPPFSHPNPFPSIHSLSLLEPPKSSVLSWIPASPLPSRRASVTPTPQHHPSPHPRHLLPQRPLPLHHPHPSAFPASPSPTSPSPPPSPSPTPASSVPPSPVASTPPVSPASLYRRDGSARRRREGGSPRSSASPFLPAPPTFTCARSKALLLWSTSTPERCFGYATRGYKSLYQAGMAPTTVHRTAGGQWWSWDGDDGRREGVRGGGRAYGEVGEVGAALEGG